MDHVLITTFGDYALGTYRRWVPEWADGVHGELADEDWDDLLTVKVWTGRAVKLAEERKRRFEEEMDADWGPVQSAEEYANEIVEIIYRKDI